MAHKPNNPTHDFGDQQFDLMLRRHLQRNGSSHAPCAGFDAETASAYIERSLLTAATQAYESHLADCAGCRRHVAALVRLQAELTPQATVAPIPSRALVPARESAWTRWMAHANAWWAEVNFNWGLAGAGALATVLIAAVAFNGYQNRATSPSSSTSSIATKIDAQFRTADTATEVGQANDAAISPDEAALIATTTTNETTAAAKSASTTSASIPTLPNLGAVKPELASNNFSYGAAPASPMRVIDIPEDVVAMNPEKMAAPMVSLPATREFFGSSFSNGEVRGTAVSFGQPGAQSGALMPIQLRAIQSPPTVSSLNVVKDQLERHSDVAGLVRADGRKLSDKESESDDKNTKLAKAEASRARAILNTLMGQRGVMSFVPNKTDDSRTKEAEKTTDQPLVKPMTKRVNGHTFYFERGFWIDEDYRSDTTLPLVKLTRGSERYQNILIENPTLDTFFQLGQVIVVWKGKVYEVRK